MSPPENAGAAQRAGVAAKARKILAEDPQNPDALHALGLVHLREGRFAEAVDCLERVVAADPESAELRERLIAALDAHGRALAAAGEGIGAEAVFARLLELDPDNAATHSNLGNALADRGALAEAEASLRRAVALDPDFAQAHYNLSMVLLMRGAFAEGWDEYDWRWRCPEFPSTRREFPYPRWQGGDLAGKTLLVWSEQGVGDEIMFAGALPDAAAAAEHLILECNERFVPLFARSFPGATVVARTDPPDPAIAAAGIDAATPMASLCRWFRRSAEAFPKSPGNYLVADPETRAQCRARYEGLGDGRIVGVAWRSGNPIKGPERSAPLALWDPVLAVPGNVFVCLQYGDVGGEIAEAEARTGVRIHRDDAVDPFASMDDWAAQVAAMDVVVSVDNSTIQVSGSLGVPTITMLSRVPEWRFGMEGEGHLWHPSIRIIRPEREGAAEGDWPGVMAAAAAAL